MLTLASYLEAGEDEVICDLAQYYHIYDYEQLPLDKVAVFVAGLPEESRIVKKLSGQKLSYDSLLLTSIFDQINLLLWSKTKDGQKGKNRPDSLTKEITGKKEESKVTAFTSGEDFKAAREKMIKELERGEVK
ncbi:hypothetical protein F6I34_07985 [Aerococcus tenax]|uniref:Phage protein n=1 Tax=Aerococcus tenax TaxID=3078812 RepID=A0A329PHB5_9LACT|nr:hypothetical protein F6I34_07985 [Aerococcus urinae]RAV94132.1 hypothetical protein DBT53_07075 [Aerococcus mictus]RAV94177.1 hypothetical protein DBT53_07310 [Aerococcus mictus]